MTNVLIQETLQEIKSHSMVAHVSSINVQTQHHLNNSVPNDRRMIGCFHDLVVYLKYIILTIMVQIKNEEKLL